MQTIGVPGSVKQLCVLNATNMGPGPAYLYCCIARERLNWRRQAKFGLLNPIEGNPMALPHRAAGPFVDGLPLVELTPGKSKAFYFPYTAECFLTERIIRVGVQDTYGRNHWCRRAQVREARQRHQKDFPPP
jgi:hypothetical protein